jgi:hypothetical protein
MATSHRPVWALPIEAVYPVLDTTVPGVDPLRRPTATRKVWCLTSCRNRPVVPCGCRFADQLTHFMALLLWVAGILAFISHTAALGWAIWAVIWINAVFSFWQEFRAEQALSALKNVLPSQVQVYRDGELQQIPARELVQGRCDAAGGGRSHLRRCPPGEC